VDLVGGFWHLGNFFAPALGLGLIASALCKLFWRGPLKGIPLLRLWAWTAAAAAAASIAGLVVFARDGAMATYAAMVVACALVLWWAGRRPAA
jgi:hypothetical protein